MDERETFRRTLQEKLSSMPERVMTSPQDDWQPVMFMQDDEGEITQYPMPWGLLDGSDSGLEMLSGLLTMVVTMERPERFAILTNGWRVPGMSEAEKMEWPNDLAKHPRAEERLWLRVADPNGDEHWTTRILRHEQTPPSLGEWELLDRREHDHYGAVYNMQKGE